MDSKILVSKILTELEEMKKATVKEIEELDDMYWKACSNREEELADGLLFTLTAAKSKAIGIAEAERVIVRIAKENGI